MGQMSAEEVKNLPISKTRSRYQLFSVIYLILVLPSIFLGMMTGFFFDAPGSENNKLLITLAVSILLFVPVTLISGIGGLLSLRDFVEDKPSMKSRIFLWLPVIHFIFNVTLFVFGAVVESISN